MSTALYFGIALVIAGLLLFVYQVFIRPKIKPDGIKDYERLRDKITLKEIEGEEEDNNVTSNDSVGFVSGLVSLAVTFIVIGIVLSVGSQVLSSVEEQQSQYNVSSQTLNSLSTLTNFIPIMSLMAVVAIVIGLLLNFFRYENIEEEPKKKKSTKAEGIKHYEGMRDKMTLREGERK